MQVEGQLQKAEPSSHKGRVLEPGWQPKERTAAPKRRSFFSKNYKIDPFWTSPAKPAAPPATPSYPSWSDLPEGILELILTAAKGQSLAAAHNSRFYGKGELGWDRMPMHASCVCRAWHCVARRVFFPDWWQGSQPIKHPLQLFSLSPRVLGVEQRLVRCHMRREHARDCVRFTLYLGDDPSEPNCKFLMVALVSRWDTTLYLNQAGTQPPCATIAANVFGTHFGLMLHPSVHPFAAMDAQYDPAAEGSPSTKPASRAGQALQLADVEYRTRLRGFMRPRRMRVHLPGPDALLPYRSDELCRRSRLLLAGFPSAASLKQLELSQRGGSIYSSSLSLDAVPIAFGEEDAEPEEPARACSTSLDCLSPAAAGGGSAADLPPGTQLRNKPPHWNEKLRCWCLNFKGRVKLASVKNFQLVDAADPSKELVMQFGKADVDAYILDYNSAVISAVQAFAIALSAFETRLLL